MLQDLPFILSGATQHLTKKKKANTAPETKTMTKEDMIKRGDYLVTTGSCNDCHSPKIMTKMGPVPDSTRLLSGHPASDPLPPLSKTDISSPWIRFTPDLTAFVGPWGISYSANLTPDSATGMVHGVRLHLLIQYAAVSI